MFWNKYPYSNLHDLNLDWIIGKITDIDEAVEESAEQAAAAKNSANAAGTSAANAATSATTATNAATSASNSAARAETLTSSVNNLQNQIDVERARIDQFTELTEGSTTGDAEMADGRVGYDGITYQNIGNAIRSQIGNLYKMESLMEGMAEIFPNFHPGFINPSTLLINTDAPGPHLYSDPILIPAGTVLYAPTVNRSGSVAMVTECSSTGQNLHLVLRGTTTNQSTGAYVKYPFVNDTYVRLSFNTYYDDTYKHFYTAPLNDYVITESNWYDLNVRPLGYSSGPITESGPIGGPAYIHSDYIVVPKGFTVEFWSGGSESNQPLTHYDPMFETVDGSVSQEYGIVHEQWTATSYGSVRLSGRVNAPDDAFGAVVPVDKFKGWKIYYKPNHNQERKDSRLYGKKICAIGDSLIRGNILNIGATWLPTLTFRYNATGVNLGVNGGTVANTNNNGTTPSIYERLSSVPEDADYIILLGGANDKRVNVPLGDANSSDPYTFNGALNLISESLRTDHPKAKIIYMTTYWRYSSRNSIGLGDKDYADAMVEAAKRNHIPHFNNFTESGVDFLNEAMRSWMDESKDIKKNVGGVIEYRTETHHFSIEGYEWLEPLYEEVLKRL